MERINRELLDFIDRSPTAYHTSYNAKMRLIEDGYTELFESQTAPLKQGGRYFVCRGASLIAFRIPDRDYDGFQIVVSHTDSPCFKLKPDFELCDKNYLRISSDKYGGPILSSWLDRPLSVAGRIVVRQGNSLISKNVSTQREVALIPNVAPHLKTDKDAPLSMLSDMCALLGEKGSAGALLEELAHTAGVEVSDIASHDLYLVNRQRGCVWGADGAFVSAPRLDDLQCVFSSLTAFLLSSDEENVPVFAIFDREEIGSGGQDCANSSFLPDTLHRISLAVGKTYTDHLTALSNSFFVSADNAHAVHPNHPELSDANNNALLNSGIVIKHSALGRYVTDAESTAIIKMLCDYADVPFCEYTNRSDMPGGSTLGHILQTQLSISGADIGLAQLAMHSSFETAGALDTEYAYHFFKAFYNSHIYKKENSFVVENF